jgi:hypothetical protein
VTPPPPTTIEGVLDRVVDAYTTLAEIGEAIDDEWSYIQDLTGAWQGRFDEVRAARGADPIGPDVAAAVEAAIGETARIADPHRAVDCLSTFPQVVLVALGERP